MLQIVRAETPAVLEQARALFEEYASTLEFSLDFQDFERELAAFPGDYAEPAGCILVARSDDRPVGCVALRDLRDGVCEMKRLYIVPSFRGRGLGRDLARAIIEEARRLRYERMRLDTVPSMKAAIALYESLGFKAIPAYRHNPIPGASFMELVLGGS